MKPLIHKFGQLLGTQLGKQYRGYRWFVHVFLCSTASEIAAMLGISPAAAESFRGEMISTFKQDFTILAVPFLLKCIKNAPSLTLETGIPAFDAILGGGFKSRRVYQLFGEHGSGKTEIIYQLLGNVIARTGTTGGNASLEAFFIDTNNAFRPERLTVISRGTIDLSRIKVASCYSLQHLVSLLATIEQSLHANDARLVIIDSIIATAFSLHDGDLHEKYALITVVLDAFERIAREKDACIIFMNDATQMMNPAGGDIFLDKCDYAISLKKSEFDPASIRAQLVKAYDLPDGKARFRVTEDGIIP